MKIYVITQGSYSDYHICAVTDDPDKAEVIADYFGSTGWYVMPEIEEYDTDTLLPVVQGKIYFRVDFNNMGYVTEVNEIKYDDYYHGEEIEEKNDGIFMKILTGYAVRVWADDEEHAAKIAEDKLAEYRYRKEMDE